MTFSLFNSKYIIPKPKKARFFGLKGINRYQQYFKGF